MLVAQQTGSALVRVPLSRLFFLRLLGNSGPQGFSGSKHLACQLTRKLLDQINTCCTPAGGMIVGHSNLDLIYKEVMYI